jgi:hypothetical protein
MLQEDVSIIFRRRRRQTQALLRVFPVGYGISHDFSYQTPAELKLVIGTRRSVSSRAVDDS